MNSEPYKGRPQARCVEISLMVAFACAVGGCALPTIPDHQAGIEVVKSKLEPAWQAPLAHDGKAVQMQAWWQRWNDPALLQLQSWAQAESPGLSQALARIEQARASLAAAGAAELPAVDLNGRLRRAALGVPPFGAPNTQAGVSLDASWEIDLFGIVARGRDAAQQRLDARRYDWHEARISLQAEVANTYLAWRSCSDQTERLEEDSKALVSTVSLTELKVKAGFTAPADAALLRASLANTRNQLLAQSTECRLLVKTLAYLSGHPDAAVMKVLATPAGAPPSFVVPQVPAQALAQRPDLSALESELAALAADVGVAEANRRPRLTLNGNIGWSAMRYAGVNGVETASGLAWGFGPALSLPIFDAGRRKANVDATLARYAEVSAQYRQKAKLAVKEVEEALLRLASADQRHAQAELAARDFVAFFNAAQSRYQVGVGNLIELQEARRQTIAAQLNLIQLRRERSAQWIALYKALGGGWETGQSTVPAVAPAAVTPATSVPSASPAAPVSAATKS